MLDQNRSRTYCERMNDSAARLEHLGDLHRQGQLTAVEFAAAAGEPSRSGGRSAAALVSIALSAAAFSVFIGLVAFDLMESFISLSGLLVAASVALVLAIVAISSGRDRTVAVIATVLAAGLLASVAAYGIFATGVTVVTGGGCYLLDGCSNGVPQPPQ